MMRAAFLAMLLGLVSADQSEAATLETLAYAGSCYLDESNDFADSSNSIAASCKDFLTHPPYAFVSSAVAVRASFGSIGVSASVSASQLLYGGANAVRDAYARSSLSDAISVVGVTVGWLRFPIDIAGSISLSHSLNLPSARAYGTFTMMAQGVIETFGSGVVADVNGSTLVSTGNMSTGVNDVWVPITGETTAFSVQMEAYSSCMSGGQEPGFCSSLVNLYQSARFLGVSVFDLDFNELTDVTLVSASGFDYKKGVEPHAAVVPLPSSAFLLVFGVGFFFLLARRGRGNVMLRSA